MVHSPKFRKKKCQSSLFQYFALKSLSKAKKDQNHFYTSNFQCGTFLAFKGKTNNDVDALPAYLLIIELLLIQSYHPHTMINVL